MRIDLYRALDPLAPAYLLRRRTGDLVSAVTGDVETIEYFFAHTIAPAFVAVLVPGGVLIALAVMGWPLAAGAAAVPDRRRAQPGPRRSGASTASATEARDAARRWSTRTCVDSVQGLRTIAAFDHGPARLAEIDGARSRR